MTDSAENEQMHGGEIIAKIIKQHQILTIFTLCGGHISPILVGAEQERIQVIDLRHEVNTVFAADAYSRITGRPGVAVVTAGPGVTNTLTAVKNAQMAQSPVVVLGGATATLLNGRGSLQDIDQMSLVKSCTKWSKSITTVRDLVPVLSKAFQIAQEGVPGPVFIELPLDILYPRSVFEDQLSFSNSKSSNPSLLTRLFNWYIKRHMANIFRDIPSEIKISPSVSPFRSPSSADIHDVRTIIRDSKRPVMVISSQIMLNHNTHDVVEAIHHLKIPVYLSSSARGLLGKDHPLQFRHKRTQALRESDAIILLGTELDFRLDYGRSINRKGTLVSVNRDKSSLRLNRMIRKIDKRIHADPSTFLIELSRQNPDRSWNDWMAHLRKRENQRMEEIMAKIDDHGENVNPIRLLHHIDQIMAEDSAIVADGGDFVATMSYIIQPRGPRRWLDPGPFGTLGVGGGFAIGTKLSLSSSEVWLFYGDGAAGYSLAEFDSCVRHQIPVIAIVGNDASWHQIVRDQVRIFESDVGTQLCGTSYDQVAEGFGAKGLLISTDDQIEPILKKAKELYHQGHPVLVNVLLNKSDFREGSLSM